jgi:hypothetical protein
MVTDGFTVNDPLYKAAVAVKSQSPAPRTFKIGRMDVPGAAVQTLQLTPTNTDEGVIQTVTVTAPDGTTTVISRTNGAAETVATIVTALQPLVNAVAGITATDDTTYVGVVSDDVEDLFNFSAFGGGLGVNDKTPDRGVTAALTAVRAEDDDWYCLLLDNNSEVDILAAAAAIEPLAKIFGCNTADLDVLNDVAGNVLEDLNGFSYKRTFCTYNGQAVLSYFAAGQAGERLSSDPGTSTWWGKTIVGQAADNLSATQRSNISGSKGNWYETVAQINIVQEGWMVVGEYIDIIRYIDFLTARIQERVFGVLANAEKVPFIDIGIDMIAAEVRGQLRLGETSSPPALVPGSSSVDVPALEDTETADRATRTLRDLDFQSQLAGAIHNVVIRGRLTV